MTSLSPYLLDETVTNPSLKGKRYRCYPSMGGVPKNLESCFKTVISSCINKANMQIVPQEFDWPGVQPLAMTCGDHQGAALDEGRPRQAASSQGKEGPDHP